MTDQDQHGELVSEPWPSDGKPYAELTIAELQARGRLSLEEGIAERDEGYLYLAIARARERAQGRDR